MAKSKKSEAGIEPTRKEREMSRLAIVSGKIEAGKDPLAEEFYGKPVRQHVLEFGALIPTVVGIIAFVQAYSHHRIGLAICLLIGMVVFYLLGRFSPRILAPLWSYWMTFAEYLGLVVNFLILSVVWYLVVVPLALLLKAIGKRTIDISYKDGRNSYWLECNQKRADFKLMERQF